MDVLEPIEPEGIPGPTTPPSLGHPLGDPYALPETELAAEFAPAPHRRRLGRALVATAVVAGIAGAAIGVGVAGSHGRATLTFQPAATTGGSGSTGSSSSARKPHNRQALWSGRIVAGTVSKVNGHTITVSTLKTNTTETITTNTDTKYGKIILGKVSDIKTQQTVAVLGTSASNGQVTANYVVIVPAGLLTPPAGAPKAPANAPKHPFPFDPPEGAPNFAPPKAPAGAPALPRLGGLVIGKVTSVNGTSFVVTRRDGTKVTVNTTSTTKVIEQATATAADVVVNAHIVAIGTPGTTANTMTASRIEILPASLASLSPSGLGLPFALPFALPFGGAFGGPGSFGFGFGPGMRMGHGFGGWGMRGPDGQPANGSGSGSGSSSGSSSSGTATTQSVSA